MHRELIFSCQVKDEDIVFEPFILTLQDLALVNRMRKVVSQSFASLDSQQDSSAPPEGKAVDTVTDLIRLLLRSEPIDPQIDSCYASRCRGELCMEESFDYLPQLSLKFNVQPEAQAHNRENLDTALGSQIHKGTDIALASACLQYFKCNIKSFPSKPSQLNQWLNSKSQVGTIQTQLCETVWRDLLGEKMKSVRTRLCELLISLRCVSRGPKLSLIWNMTRVDSMLSSLSESESSQHVNPRDNNDVNHRDHKALNSSASNSDCGRRNERSTLTASMHGVQAAVHVHSTIPCCVGSSEVTLVCFVSNSELATVSKRDGVQLWLLQTDSETAQWTCRATLDADSEAGRVWSIACSPDGLLLAAARRNTVRLWSTEAAKALGVLEGHRSCVFAVAFSPDGSKVATASTEVRIFDPQSRQEIIFLGGHGEFINTVAFSPDGMLLATASDDKTVKLWCMVSSEWQTTFEHQHRVDSLAFCPVNKDLLVSASAEGDITMLHIEAKAVALRFCTLSSCVNWIAFSPDGAAFAAAMEDKTVKVWSTQSQRLLADLSEHSGAVNCLQFSPDGASLATASSDGRVLMWAVEGLVRLKSDSPAVSEAFVSEGRMVTMRISAGSEAAGSLVLQDSDEKCRDSTTGSDGEDCCPNSSGQGGQDADLAVAVACLQYFQYTLKSFPAKNAQLYKWLDSKSRLVDGTVHTELCWTVWSDLLGEKSSKARRRLTKLLVGYGCATRGKKGSLVWDMRRVDSMLGTDSASESLERLESHQDYCLDTSKGGPWLNEVPSPENMDDIPRGGPALNSQDSEMVHQRCGFSISDILPAESAGTAGGQTELEHSEAWLCVDSESGACSDETLSEAVPLVSTCDQETVPLASYSLSNEAQGEMESVVMARFYGASDLVHDESGSVSSDCMTLADEVEGRNGGARRHAAAAASLAEASVVVPAVPSSPCKDGGIKTGSASSRDTCGAEPVAAGPQDGALVIARFHGDAEWYECRVEGIADDGWCSVVFRGYEDDGPQVTGPEDVLAVEPCLVRALAARHLGGPWTARICGSLGLWLAAQLQHVADPDVAGIGLRPVQRNALLALLREHRAAA